MRLSLFEGILQLTPREYNYALAMGKSEYYYSFRGSFEGPPLLENITTPIEWDKENNMIPSRELPFPSREKHYAFEWGMLLFLNKGIRLCPSRGEDHTFLREYLYPLPRGYYCSLAVEQTECYYSCKGNTITNPFTGKLLSPSRGILLLPLRGVPLFL